jgi:catechol 2,3-dioxygenase-like lactoylglutathione lyase family enzyme
MADQVAHQHVRDVVIEQRHSYTNKYYSNGCVIARTLTPRYSRHREVKMLRGIKFIGIPVRDQDVALKFYTDALGMKVTTDQPFTPQQRWIELKFPGADTGVTLFTPPGHEDRIGQFQSISFWCDDVFAGADALKKNGVKFTKEPATESWGTAAVFCDPDGNQFVLSSRK